MNASGNDTIAAVATGAGGGIGIVRISGPDATAIAARILRDKNGSPLDLSRPFLLRLGIVADSRSAEPIDEVLAVSMPEGRSYTGETTVEIQSHGGRVVLDSVLRVSLDAGARLADPGEFTKRAFLSGRIDLTRAEAVAQLIGAESEEARRCALRLLGGALAKLIIPLRERLLDLAARLEASLNFDDGEVSADIPPAADVASLADEIRELAGRADDGTHEASRTSVALAGRSNSGKSSIFNYLLKFSRSIVSPFPGTTRDYIAERSLIDGTSVTLVDTAGLRETGDIVEAEGIRRSLERIAESDIVVVVIDGSEAVVQENIELVSSISHRSPLVVISKSDLPLRFDPRVLESFVGAGSIFSLSTVTGDGFPDFTSVLASRCRSATMRLSQSMASPNIRQRDALFQSARSLDIAAEHLDRGDHFLDQAARELRSALAALGEITGETATEDVLDRIFGQFCVGK